MHGYGYGVTTVLGRSAVFFSRQLMTFELFCLEDTNLSQL